MDNADREPGDMNIVEKADREIADLVARIRAGDRAAEDEFIREYGPYVRIVLGRQRGILALCSKRDQDDYCQSVFVDVVLALRDGRCQFATAAGARAALAKAVNRNVIKHLRLNLAGCRDIRREDPRPVDELELASREPDPVEEAEYKDLAEALAARLPPVERCMAEQRRAGRTYIEIACENGWSPEWVERRVSRAVCEAADAMGLQEVVAGIASRAEARRRASQCGP